MIELFSESRMFEYESESEYFDNIILCKDAYPLLCLFEVILRNRIDKQIQKTLLKKIIPPVIILEKLNKQEDIIEKDYIKFEEFLITIGASFAKDFIGVEFSKISNYKNHLTNLVTHMEYVRLSKLEWLVDLYDGYEILTFNSYTMKDINESVLRFKKERKAITHDNILSNLSLGFWIDLLKNDKFFTNNNINKDAFYDAMLNQRNTSNTEIDNINKKFDTIRKFRNRVFHHEKIINHPKFDAKKIIADLLLYITKFDKDKTLKTFILRINN